MPTQNPACLCLSNSYSIIRENGQTLKKRTRVRQESFELGLPPQNWTESTAPQTRCATVTLAEDNKSIQTHTFLQCIWTHTNWGRAQDSNLQCSFLNPDYKSGAFNHSANAALKLVDRAGFEPTTTKGFNLALYRTELPIHKDSFTLVSITMWHVF